MEGDRNESLDFSDRNLTNCSFDSIYYAVHIPSDTPADDNVNDNIFTDKTEALKLVKKYKKARFKAFSYYHEAAEFVLQGAEHPNNNVSLPKSNSKKIVESSSPINAGEKSQFRGPKSQDLVKLRKGIENGDMKFVETTVWENPRYLISSGDTPSILQEGFRYNALHVAAKAKNADMCEFILNTVSNVEFIELLYGDDNHRNAEDRAKILLDLYLNTPDKGLNETPLHFAVKFGAVEAVEVLVSFPQCDRNVRNKYGKLPCQIICDRCDGYGVERLKERIAFVLGDNYYVPVLRAEDNCVPPVVGEPFSPMKPPTFRNDPLHSRLEIHAYAGPMDKKGADTFRKIWKTPPRSLMRNCGSPGGDFDSIASLKLKDPERGLETVGRELANKYDVGWKEYWPFLGCFVDLMSDEGLNQLEAYLNRKSNFNVLTLNPNAHPIKTSLFNASNDKQNVSDNKLVVSPMSELCRAFEACTLSENNGVKSKFSDGYHFMEDLNPFICLERSCQVFAHRIILDVTHLMKTEEYGGDILETQIKYLEQLILSYLDDVRFANVNFCAVHARLSALIVLQIKDLELDERSVRRYVEKVLDSKTSDCFSSDDEAFSPDDPAKKSTSTNKQLACVLGHVLNVLKEGEDNVSVGYNEDELRRIWEATDRCPCVWQTRNSRRRNQKSQKLFRSFDALPRKLNFGRDGADATDGRAARVDGGSTSSDDDDEEFFTPPTSPPPPSSSESEDDDDGLDEFDESRLPECDVYLEGDEPSKADRDVYNALRFASDKLNPKDYPNIYRWRHTISLFDENERNSWCNQKIDKSITTRQTSTPCRGGGVAAISENDLQVHASPKSWFRVTGANSPRASLTAFRNNVSLNL